MTRLDQLVGVLCLMVTGMVGRASAAEAPSTLDDLAGEYQHSDFFTGSRLVLSSAGRFRFTAYGCMVRQGTSGPASVVNGVLELSFPEPVFPYSRAWESAQKFIPVRWGERLYLVPTEEIIKFCSAVNSLHGTHASALDAFYLRRGDGIKPEPTEAPMVPPEYAKYLLDTPVWGKVTEVSNARSAWIDVGLESGLLPGMVLTVWSQASNRTWTVEVATSETGHSQVINVSGNALVSGQTISTVSPNQDYSFILWPSPTPSSKSPASKRTFPSKKGSSSSGRSARSKP